jgi:putative Mg2+ transporter-C (MgtC) family protein
VTSYAVHLAPGQGWAQLGDLMLAFVLSGVIGLERELAAKAAGLRTNMLVGLGSALFMLVSGYGFANLLVERHVALDPSRIAAQIVSGIGFLGGGMIFVHRSAVRGLTTAATIWVVAAVGMACGGDLPVLATVVTVLYLVIVRGGGWVQRNVTRMIGHHHLRVTYRDGHGVLRRVLEECGRLNLAVLETSAERQDRDGLVTVVLTLSGKNHLHHLAGVVSELAGVVEVGAGDADD